MKMNFTHALLIEGKFFSQGVHDVPEKIAAHEHFHKYSKIGWIHPPGEGVMMKQESVEERNQRLAKELLVKAEPKPEVTAPEVVVEEAPEFDVVEAQSKKQNKKSKR